MVVTVGSINMDLAVRIKEYPRAGETVLGSDCQIMPGGKGANQAVAAARAGSPVRFVGCLGRDIFGDRLYKHLAQEGIDVQWLVRMEVPTGVALISVDQHGQNRIVVSPGSNGRLMESHVNSSAFVGAQVVLLQLEIPMPTVLAAAAHGRRAGAIVILNAAPARELAQKELANVDVLVVNELEAVTILNRPPFENILEAQAGARALQLLGPSTVITLGAQGCVWSASENEGYVPPFTVNAVDTTGAGDAFVGMLASCLAKAEALPKALIYASAAGALAATGEGAQSSFPRLQEVKELVNANYKYKKGIQ